MDRTRSRGAPPTSISVKQSVVINDGAYGEGRSSNEVFFDLSGVEVPEGPQAAFFAKRSTIADPIDEDEAQGRGGCGLNEREAPLDSVSADSLGARLAFRRAQQFVGIFTIVSAATTFGFSKKKGAPLPPLAKHWLHGLPFTPSLLRRAT